MSRRRCRGPRHNNITATIARRVAIFSISVLPAGLANTRWAVTTGKNICARTKIGKKELQLNDHQLTSGYQHASPRESDTGRNKQRVGDVDRVEYTCTIKEAYLVGARCALYYKGRNIYRPLDRALYYQIAVGKFLVVPCYSL